MFTIRNNIRKSSGFSYHIINVRKQNAEENCKIVSWVLELVVSSFTTPFLSSLSATISAISDGMQYGWTAPVIPILESPETPVHIEESDVVWLETIYMLGGLAGLPITIYLVDKIGRKWSILLASATSLVCWILIAVASRVEVLYAARFLTGIAGDVAFVSTPMYIAEIADQKIRGFLAGLIYIMMLVGLLIVYSVAPFVKIYVSSLVGAAFLAFQLCTFSFMPESPYYLLVKNKKEKAAKNLRKLRYNCDIETELREISAAVDRQNSEKGSPLDLIMVKSNRKALIIMSVLNAAQHFSSISVILMNLHTILKAGGSEYIDFKTAAIIFSVVMLVASIIAVAVVDKAGRKILLTSSSLLTGASLAVLASYFAVKNSGVDTSSYSWIPIASVMVYAAVFKYGLGVVPIILTGELFPTNVKAIGMTISDAMYVVFSVLSIYMYQFLADAYGLHVPFFIFAGSCIFTAIFCALAVPETKGKTLEEIQYILKGLPYPREPEEGKSNGNVT